MTGRVNPIVPSGGLTGTRLEIAGSGWLSAVLDLMLVYERDLL